MANTANTKVLKGSVTTDGAGAGSASLVTTGYKLDAIRVRNISLTGGTISAKDNNGAGSERLPATAQPASELRSTVFVPNAVTSPLVLAIAGGGATKSFRYEVVLVRSVAWTPTDAGPLTAWWDFGDKASLFQDTSATIPVLNSGDTIKRIADKSGNNRFMSEATNGPTYIAVAPDSYSLARFDGTNDILATNAVMPTDTAFTVFLVARKRSDPTAAAKVLFAPDNNAAIFAHSANSATKLVSDPTPTVLAGIAIEPNIIVMRINSVSSLDFYFNGGAAQNIDPTDAITTSATWGIGGNTPASNFGDYDVFECMVYSDALTAVNLNNVGEYLSAKWGLRWTTAT